MIADSSCIICLSKINKLDLLKEVHGKIFVSGVVKEECLIQGKPGFHAISEAIEKKWIVVCKPKLNTDYALHKGENEAINLALEKKQAIILDDFAAKTMAESLGLKTERTTTVLFKAIEKKIISKKEGISLFNKLIENGYYISPEIYAIILSKLTE